MEGPVTLKFADLDASTNQGHRLRRLQTPNISMPAASSGTYFEFQTPAPGLMLCGYVEVVSITAGGGHQGLPSSAVAFSGTMPLINRRAGTQPGTYAGSPGGTQSWPSLASHIRRTMRTDATRDQLGQGVLNFRRHFDPSSIAAVTHGVNDYTRIWLNPVPALYVNHNARDGGAAFRFGMGANLQCGGGHLWTELTVKWVFYFLPMLGLEELCALPVASASATA